MYKRYGDLLPEYLCGANILKHASILEEQDNKIEHKTALLKSLQKLERPVLIEKTQTTSGTATIKVHIDVETPLQSVALTGDYNNTKNYNEDDITTQDTIEFTATTEDILVNPQFTVVVTCFDGFTYTKSYPENDTRENNSNDHDEFLDILGNYIGIQRHRYNSYQITNAMNTIPPFFGKTITGTTVEECTEDDYYYYQRLRYFVENYGTTDFVLLYLNTTYGVDIIDNITIVPAEDIPSGTSYEQGDYVYKITLVDDFANLDEIMPTSEVFSKYVPITRQAYLIEDTLSHVEITISRYEYDASVSNPTIKALVTRTETETPVKGLPGSIRINRHHTNGTEDYIIINGSTNNNGIITFTLPDILILEGNGTITMESNALYDGNTYTLEYDRTIDWENPDSWELKNNATVVYDTTDGLVVSTGNGRAEFKSPLNARDGTEISFKAKFPSSGGQIIVGVYDEGYNPTLRGPHGIILNEQSSSAEIYTDGNWHLFTITFEISGEIFGTNEAEITVADLQGTTEATFTESLETYIRQYKDMNLIISNGIAIKDITSETSTPLSPDWYNADYWTNESGIDTINNRVSVSGGIVAYFTQYSLNDITGVEYTVNHNNRDGRQWMGFYNPTTEKWIGQNWTHDPCTLDNTATGESINVGQICSDNNIRNTASRLTTFTRTGTTLTCIVDGVTLGTLNLGSINLSDYYLAQYDQQGFGHSLQDFNLL
ncbi:MAG: hypothetical protein BZ138_05965 [Methanosphaera sp. rholeuAM270]|nr:MAG: hypothetical protein BZ138_05965 [Methanosphaera sp. rholeuAM270]